MHSHPQYLTEGRERDARDSMPPLAPGENKLEGQHRRGDKSFSRAEIQKSYLRFGYRAGGCSSTTGWAKIRDGISQLISLFPSPSHRASRPFGSHYVINGLQSELGRYTEAELLVNQAALIFSKLL